MHTHTHTQIDNLWASTVTSNDSFICVKNIHMHIYIYINIYVCVYMLTHTHTQLDNLWASTVTT